MMVLVDTTVWIGFFAARALPQVAAPENLITNREDICICGIIFTEVLQGTKKDSQFRNIRDLFKNLIFLPMVYSTFLQSAEI